MLITALVTLLAGYSLIAAVAFFCQRSLIYAPNVERPGDADVRLRDLQYWPSTRDYRGFIAEGASPNHGTVIVFHGNAGRAVDRMSYVRALGRRGFRVILAEFPGYGGRSGAPGEREMVADARWIVNEAAKTTTGPLYVFGESLGCGVAAQLAGDPSLPIRGVALITPWDTLPDVAQGAFPFLPARFLVRDRFDSVKSLRQVKIPVAILLCGQDTTIPTRHGQRLFDTVEGPKKRWLFPDCGHNDWPSEPNEKWWDEVMTFLSA